MAPRGKRESKTTCVRLRLTVPPKAVGEPLLHTLSHDFNVTPNVLRGNIGAKKAWVELEIHGSRADLDRTLEFIKARGIKIEQLD